MSELRASQRAWIRLPSGGRLDLINPAPDAWTDDDMGKMLARTYRWAGASVWPDPLSVAQHSLLVLAVGEQLFPTPLKPSLKLKLLLHDGEEGLVGTDCITPLKAVLGEPFARVSRNLMAAIEERYGLPDWTPEEYVLYKEADRTAAASEGFHCAGWTVEELRDVLEISSPILEADPLAAIYHCTPWEPWESRVAAHRFTEKLEALLEEVNRPTKTARYGTYGR